MGEDKLVDWYVGIKIHGDALADVAAERHNAPRGLGAIHIQRGWSVYVRVDSGGRALADKARADEVERPSVGIEGARRQDDVEINDTRVVEIDGVVPKISDPMGG